ncbi:exonuclease domain-containing protein [Chromobacterium sp. IIBBL 290-4]|uniref:exonuclease domain-containing protein n=1 Tax=Chromobacterium sp. IIBBL 290-4 TaxID=2953890 RepID=UPI0020B67975|nr:exonuclease domain-containing protein [Chromobacterium sp. IIBBL 290-4]UTH75033.1 exonuclease domain-containing protein [Chromobacterium sp. IIBBL 290-4]
MLPFRRQPESEARLHTLFAQPCAIVDLETTGGNIARDRITEVGLVLIDGERVERLSWLVNPGQPIPPFIENMTGISNEMVAAAPPFAELADGLLATLQGRLLLAHNARFDYGFLRNEFRRAGMRFQARALCTVKLSRRLYPQHFKHSLDSLIARHGIEMPERHRALADAEAVYRFIQIASAELGEDKVAYEAGQLLSQPAELSSLPAELQQQLEEMPDSAGVYALFGADDRALYVGRAPNLYRKALGHFAERKPNRHEVKIDEPVARVEWRECLGEFGAQLTELQWLARWKPVHNPKARMMGEVCTLQLQTGEDGYVRPLPVAAHAIDFTRTADLFGLFRHAREARKALAQIALAQGLCQSVLGVEQVTSRKGVACAAYRIGRCRGACVGEEGADSHNQRLLSALQRLKVKQWPFEGAVAVVERDEVCGDVTEHLFDRWCYLGSRVNGGALQGEPAFDLDYYKLLESELRKPQRELVRL